MFDWIGTYPTEKAGELVAELDRQKRSRRDYIYPATTLRMDDDGRLVFGASDTFRVGDRIYTEWADAEKAADAAGGASIEPLGKAGAIPLSPTAESQLAARLGIPLRYIRSLRDAGNRDLAATNFSTLLERDGRRMLVRTLDGHVRAILSDSYKVMDNGDLFFAAAETFQQVGADLWQARLSEDRFEMLAVAPHIRGEVTLDRTFDPGDGWQSRWHGEGGDVHNAAVRISNSETGEGGLNVKLAVMRKVCQNFNVWADGISSIHAGRRISAEGLLQHMGVDAQAGSNVLFSDETRAAEGRAIWLKVKDAIRAAFNPETFHRYIEQLNHATTQVLPKPEKAVEAVVAAFELSEEARHQIMANLLRSGDRTRYGLVQAVTETAHTLDAERDPANASRFESIGGELVEMSDDRFASMVGGSGARIAA